jgi:hypothetical protein
MKEVVLSLWLTLFGYSVATTQTTVTTYEDARKAIIREFKEECPIAIGVFYAESMLIPDIKGDHGSSIGITQVHLPSWKRKIPAEDKEEWLKNFQNNVKFAKYIRDNSGRGWGNWTMYNNGKYKAFMDYSCLEEIE